MKHAHSKKGHLNYTINSNIIWLHVYYWWYIYLCLDAFLHWHMKCTSCTWWGGINKNWIGPQFFSFSFIPIPSYSVTITSAMTKYFMECNHRVLLIALWLLLTVYIASIYENDKNTKCIPGKSSWYIVSDIITTPILRLGISNEQIVLQGYWIPGPYTQEERVWWHSAEPQGSLKVYSLLYA